MSASDPPKACGTDHAKAFSMPVGNFDEIQVISIMAKPGINAVLSIPNHREVAIGMLRKLVRKAGLNDLEYRTAFEAR